MIRILDVLKIDNPAPLKEEEIDALLILAKAVKDIGDSQLFARIQARILRAVPGITIPYDRGSEAYEKVCRIDDIFVEAFKSGNLLSKKTRKEIDHLLGME